MHSKRLAAKRRNEIENVEADFDYLVRMDNANPGEHVQIWSMPQD